MKKLVYSFLMGFLTVSLTGCITAKKVIKERLDQNIAGNRGYLQGTAPAPSAASKTTREYIDIRVELPTWGEVKKELPRHKPVSRKTLAQDKGLRGNHGYISSAGGFEEELPPIHRRMPGTQPARAEGLTEEEYMGAEKALGADSDVSVLSGKKPIASPRLYKVRNGDTLSQISKDFYGKASKWTYIYESNSDKIKNPARLKVGTVLLIPELPDEPSAHIK